MTRMLCFGDSNTYGYPPGGGMRMDPATRWLCPAVRLLLIAPPVRPCVSQVDDVHLDARACLTVRRRGAGVAGMALTFSLWSMGVLLVPSAGFPYDFSLSRIGKNGMIYN